MTKKSKTIRVNHLLRLGICVALIALIALIGAVMASAEDVKYSEGLEFLSKGNGTCYVTGIGSCTDTDIVIPPVSPDGDAVTRISSYAFSGCSDVKSIMLPEGIKIIGNYAFSNCSGLTSINLPEGLTSVGNYAFSDCSSLTSVNLPEGMMSIGSAAFFDCSKLTHINFPNGLTSIGGAAFSGCNSLTSIDIPESVISISNIAFSKCKNLSSISVAEMNPIYHSSGNCLIHTESKLLILGCGTSVIPDDGSVTSIGYVAFAECNGLTSINIPACVQDIHEYAFYNCNKLTSVNIPSDSQLLSIGDSAFTNCPIMPSINLPEGLGSIGVSAFSHCSFLKNISIPSSMSYIGELAFYACHSLTDVYYSGSEEEWNTMYIGVNNHRLLNATIHYNTTLDENGILYTSNGDGTCYVSGSSIDVGPDIVIPSVSPAGDLVTKIGCSVFNSRRNLTSVVIPSSVIRIDEAAFCGCSNLTSVTFSEGLEHIEMAAFDSCGKLTSVSFPNSLKGIGVFAFLGCESLTDVVLPDNMKYISTAAFAFCNGLTSFTFPDGLTHVAMSVIENCKNLTSIYIPISVQVIEPLAVFGCDSLTDVYYEGTLFDWSNIDILYNNPEDENLLGATIHCIDTPCTLTAASLTLGDSLTMNYYAKADPAYGIPAMRFTYRGKTETVPGIPTETEGEYVFSLTGIAPQCMGETIKAELILTLEDGTELVVDAKESYSVRAYCDDALAANPDNKALVTLLADLLAYGDAAQDYANYNEDTPVSEGFAAAPSEWEDVTDTDFTLSDKTRDDIRFTAAGVHFAYVNRLYFKLKAADLTGVTLTVNGKTYTAEDLTLVEDTADTYILYTDPVYATEFDKVFTAELSVDGEVIQTLTYSVKSYVYAKQNGENAEMAALARALYAYGRSAIAYKQEQ